MAKLGWDNKEKIEGESKKGMVEGTGGEGTLAGKPHSSKEKKPFAQERGFRLVRRGYVD